MKEALGSARVPANAGPVGEVMYRLRGVRFHRREPSGRSVLISGMVLFMVVVLASPLQTYLNRRAAVASSVQLQDRLRAEVITLQQQTAQWNDPAYIERQARARLQYVRPGDTLYTVLGAQASAPGSASSAQAKVVAAPHSRSWNATLWASVLQAGRADGASSNGASSNGAK